MSRNLSFAVQSLPGWRVFCFGTFTFLALAASRGQNLIVNPGFETGSTTGWFGSQLVASSSTPHAGSFCGSSLMSGFSTAAGQDLLGKLREGQAYTWSGYLKLQSPSAPISLRLNQGDSAGSRSTLLTNFVVSSGWALYSATFSLTVSG